MRKYVIIDTVKGSVDSIMQWGDDRDFPSNIVLELNQEMVTIDNEIDVIEYGDLYNFNTKLFTKAPYVKPIILPTEIEILQSKIVTLQTELSSTKDVLDFLIMS